MSPSKNDILFLLIVEMSHGLMLLIVLLLFTESLCRDFDYGIHLLFPHE